MELLIVAKAPVTANDAEHALLSACDLQTKERWLVGRCELSSVNFGCPGEAAVRVGGAELQDAPSAGDLGRQVCGVACGARRGLGNGRAGLKKC